MLYSSLAETFRRLSLRSKEERAVMGNVEAGSVSKDRAQLIHWCRWKQRMLMKAMLGACFQYSGFCCQTVGFPSIPLGSIQQVSFSRWNSAQLQEMPCSLFHLVTLGSIQPPNSLIDLTKSLKPTYVTGLLSDWDKMLLWAPESKDGEPVVLMMFLDLPSSISPSSQHGQ